MFATIGITAGVEEYWSSFFIAFALLGVGMGITVAPLTTAVMGAASEDNSGIASGINNTVARAAGVLAVALMGALVIFSFRAFIDSGMEDLALSGSAKNEIIIESSKLAAARAPVGLTAAYAHEVDQLFKDGFVSAFNRVVYLASLLMILGGGVAFLSIKNKEVSMYDQ